MPVFVVEGVLKSDGTKCEISIYAPDEQSAKAKATEMGSSFSYISVRQKLSREPSLMLLAGLICIVIGLGGFLFAVFCSSGQERAFANFVFGLGFVIGVVWLAVGGLIVAFDVMRNARHKWPAERLDGQTPDAERQNDHR